MGGAQLLSASVSWAPTAGGHTARQPLPSPSHLESTHETHAARRGLAAGRGRCEKRTSHAPLAHARASPGEVGSSHFILLSGSSDAILGWFQFNPVLCGFVEHLHRRVRPRVYPGGAQSLGRQI